MKALIFNSGLGSRLGDLTKDRPKALVKLSNGETVFERQIRLLSACGIKDFVVTTGPFADQIEATARPFVEQGCTFTFVANPLYAETNYIYSMHLAGPFLRDDSFLLVHGDLVFDAAYVQAVLDADLPSLGSVDESVELPEKDFKARVEDGMIAEIGVGIFDSECAAFQPFYKLSRESMGAWLDSVGRFVEAGEVRVYAEDAANAVLGDMRVAAFPCDGHVVAEVDTPEDLQRVSEAVRLADFEQQPVLEANRDGRLSLVEGFCPVLPSERADVADLLCALGAKRPLVVSGSRFEASQMRAVLELAGIRFALFSGYGSNPSYEQVVEGVRAFKEAGCDSVVSVGGGSAIDVAKCVKMFATMPGDGVESRFVDMPRRFSSVPHVAVPTTAGTGSESTAFAVVYVDGEKTSVAHDCLLPDAALLDASLLGGLPAYQRKCTLLDALCQAVESYWSVRSSQLSRARAAYAIRLAVRAAAGYVAGDLDASRAMMRAANASGKAINLTTTTAPHAMSYKLTSLYGIPHGHAVALCMPSCWTILLERGSGETHDRLCEIAALVTGCDDAGAEDGLVAFEGLVEILGLDEVYVDVFEGHLDLLVDRVNVWRLSNFPCVITRDELIDSYRSVLRRIDGKRPRSRESANNPTDAGSEQQYV